VPVSDAFPSLIAFHFLGLGLGQQIYDSSLNKLRAAIRDFEPRSAWHAAAGGIDRVVGYQPWHLVGFAQCGPVRGCASPAFSAGTCGEFTFPALLHGAIR
jgi:hypothetical protein